MGKSNVIILVLIAFFAAAIIWCWVRREEYTRSILGQSCRTQRSPVDFYMNQSNNPHRVADPHQELIPLEEGGVDLYSEERRAQNPDQLFRQYKNDWEGAGNGLPYLRNDEKTRADLLNGGNMTARGLADQGMLTSSQLNYL